MYTPALKLKKSGVPILSKQNIEDIGENLVEDFCPEALTNPQPIDIENFTEGYRGMTMDYQYLSHNGIYLGMTVFNNTDKVIVYSPETRRAEYISAKARTVIIDSRLLYENQNHRYRFTVAHEAAHDILHYTVYDFNSDQITIDDIAPNPMIRCRVDNNKYRDKEISIWDDSCWMEWQANKLGSVLLMPKSAVLRVLQRYGYLKTCTDYSIVETIAYSFNVSNESAVYRLRELGYLKDVDYRFDKNGVEVIIK